ncbi:MAG: signal peptidase I [Ruminococcus albus]|nr:signal peptidase I [Ruminococcus albus]
MSDEKRKLPDIPSAEQLKRELERVRYIKNFRRTMLSTVSSLTVVAAVAVIVSVLFLPVLRVTGTSMTPTMMNDELIICSKRSDFKSGDIVAFYLNNKILLKRVIGVAGDVIDIDGEGNVFVNGRELDEPYLNEKAKGECDIELPYQVPENRVFVMGDHRAVSIDSRSTSVGCIADEYIIGRVIFRLYPFGRAGRV